MACGWGGCCCRSDWFAGEAAGVPPAAGGDKTTVWRGTGKSLKNGMLHSLASGVFLRPERLLISALMDSSVHPLAISTVTVE